MITASTFGVSRGDLVSLIGGGGKTTTMLALARDISRRGRVIVTTTTKIWPPDIPIRIGELPIGEDLCAAAAGYEPDGKLTGYDPDRVCEMRRASGATVICEADGSKGMPIKAWASHEPPVPSDTTLLIAVVAADAAGEPITRSAAHRFDILAERFGVSEGDLLTPRLLSAMLESPHGFLKNAPQSARKIVFLNRADRLSSEQRARLESNFARQIDAPSWDDVIIGSASSEIDSEG